MNSFTTKVALTTDIRTSSHNHTFYLGITMHYIDNNWDLKKCILDFIPIEGSHSSRLILGKIINLLQEFNLNNRIISLTTDNGSNMLACGRDLANELEICFCNLLFSHKRCAAHSVPHLIRSNRINSDSIRIRFDSIRYFRIVESNPNLAQFDSIRFDDSIT